MFKCATISLSKLSLRREFKTFRQFSFVCFKLLDTFSPKYDSEKLQHKVLPDNSQLNTFEICCCKLLLRMFAPFLFKWSLLLFRWLALVVLLWSMSKKFFLLHISFKWWLTSLPFLFIHIQFIQFYSFIIIDEILHGSSPPPLIIGVGTKSFRPK